jgi:hypothetical protein
MSLSVQSLEFPGKVSHAAGVLPGASRFGGIPVVGRSHGPAVSPEAIARRAYDRFLSDGAVHARDLEHWLRAEQQLRDGPRAQGD